MNIEKEGEKGKVKKERKRGNREQIDSDEDKPYRPKKIEKKKG